MMKHQLRCDIAEERRRRQGAQLAAPSGLQGAAEEQAVLGARHGDVEQAALLGIRAAFVQVETLLRKAGATRIGIVTEPNAAVVIFEAHDRRLKFTIRLDERTNEKGGQARRSQWRALLLCIKAKLEAVASGIETFEEAFLARVVVDGGQTVYGHVRPKLIEIAKTGHMVPLLPGALGRLLHRRLSDII